MLQHNKLDRRFRHPQGSRGGPPVGQDPSEALKGPLNAGDVRHVPDNSVAGWVRALGGFESS